MDLTDRLSAEACSYEDGTKEDERYSGKQLYGVSFLLVHKL